MQPFPLLLENHALHKMNVVLAYDSMGSALYAAENLTSLLRKDPTAPELSLSPWCFGVLSNPTWCALAAAEVLNADMLLLATSSKMIQHLPPSIEQWLEMCLGGRHPEDPFSVVAFFRSDKTPDNGDSPRLQKVQQLVERAGCKFLAPFAMQEMPCAV